MTLSRPNTSVISRSGPDLDARWSVAPVDPSSVPDEVDAEWPIEAQVPGSVHTDLLRHGLISDPFMDSNELDVQWVGEIDWCYVAEFDVSFASLSCERIELVAEGLDTLATVSLNGVVLATTENMHRTYRFDVREALHPGSNRLEIVFRSSIVEACRRREDLGYWPSASFDEPYAHIRKMAASWGWDWGPKLNTSGVWRALSLETGCAARLADIRADVRVDERDTGQIDVSVDLGAPAPDGETTVALSLTLCGSDIATVDCVIAPGHRTATVTIDAGSVERWWPAGLGAQPLYDLAIVLRNGEEVLDATKQVLGFRTIELDESADDIGHAFQFVVNGQQIFVRGVNWIPDDPLLTRVDASRYRARLNDAAELGVNLVRVWGGGIYESDEFYAACDELGLMVWQDFLFACAAYPEDELLDEVVPEASDNIRRLRSHPSLAMWNGNNENTWGHVDWGWPEQLDGKAWGERFYLDTLPGLVRALDPGRPYTQGSPSSGTTGSHPNSADHGTNHDWVVWNETDHSDYRRMVPRFVSEFGWQAPPTRQTISEYLTDDPLTATSPGMMHHQKALDGNGKLERGLRPFFDVPENFDAWHWAMQLNQARAIRTGVEHYRSHRGRCMGTIWWQFNDCWPVTSWAVLDSGGHRKPAWFALRDAYAPRLVTLQPRGSSVALIVVNDSPGVWTDTVEVRRVRFDGSLLAQQTCDIVVAPHSSLTVELTNDVAIPTAPEREMIRAGSGHGDVGDWFFGPDRDLALDAAALDVVVVPIDGGRSRVEITAHNLVRDLAVLADRLGAAAPVDGRMSTLLPGELVTFVIDAVVTPEEVSAALYSANGLVRGAQASIPT
ncbi:MAG: glycoside hydrolase family 2 TIM barrel-domain containing protein [Ilumatobacter sp.]|uniref:glycoside hydrolase family 2 protein n=1 Tax=Ilumatobacter sp. TaxID=1967498 RepID=UPI003C7967FD